DLLGAGDADDRGQARQVAHREAVAERARDREAEARIGRGDAQVAGRGDAAAAAGAGAADGGDDRHAALLDGADDAVDARLIGERVLRRLEGAELRDVGAGGERLVAGAGDEQ